MTLSHSHAISSQPVFRAECAAMITGALQHKVGPALQAVFSHVGSKKTSCTHRLRQPSVHWWSGTCRNGLPSRTASSRLPVHCRKMVLVTSTGTSQPRRQQKNEGEKTPAEGETQTGDDTTDQATKEATDAGQAASSSQDVWEVKTGSWNNPVKMAPGITQFERRLGAPMHGLMNAYQKLFPSFKKESLIPRWKTYLGGQGGSLVGQGALQPEAAKPHRNNRHGLRLELRSAVSSRAQGPHPRGLA